MPFSAHSGYMLLGKSGPINVESRNVPLCRPLRRNWQLSLRPILALPTSLAATGSMISIVAVMLAWGASQLLPDLQGNKYGKCS